MTPELAFHHPLIQRYLDGGCSVDELAALDELLRTRPAFANAFARATRLDAALADLFRLAAADVRASDAAAGAIRPSGGRHGPRIGRTARIARARATFPWRPTAAIAAAILLCVAGSVYLLRRPAREIAIETPATTRPVHSAVAPVESMPNRVLSGAIVVDGRAVAGLADGQALRVDGPAPAVVRLTDGTEVDFETGTRAVLHGRAPGLRQLVELREGAGTFRVRKGGGEFQVQAGDGRVTALGTAFSVKLLTGEQAEGASRNREGDRPEGHPVKPKLAVAVLEGTVQVEFAERTFLMSAGDNRVFSPGAEGRGGPADVRGILRQVGPQRITADTGKERRRTADTFDLAPDVRVTVDGKPAALADLRPGMLVFLQRLAGDPLVVGLRAEGPTVFGELRSVDPAARRITLAGRSGKESAAPDVTYALAPGAAVTIDGTAAGPDALAPGNSVSLKLSALDGNVVVGVVARVRREGEGRR